MILLSKKYNKTYLRLLGFCVERHCCVQIRQLPPIIKTF